MKRKEKRPPDESPPGSLFGTSFFFGNYYVGSLKLNWLNPRAEGRRSQICINAFFEWEGKGREERTNEEA